MKNLIKIFIVLALVTVKASNVCAQTTIDMKKDTIFDIDDNGSITTIINSDTTKTIFIKITITTSATTVLKYKINGVQKSIIKDTVQIDTYRLNKDNRVLINIIRSADNPLNVKVEYIKDTAYVGLNNNTLSNDVNLYSYNNTIVLENKVVPKKLTVNVYNLNGQLVFTDSTEGLDTRNEFNTNLPNGIYVVHVSDGVNTMVKKLLIGKYKN